MQYGFRQRDGTLKFLKLIVTSNHSFLTKVCLFVRLIGIINIHFFSLKISQKIYMSLVVDSGGWGLIWKFKCVTVKGDWTTKFPWLGFFCWERNCPFQKKIRGIHFQKIRFFPGFRSFQFFFPRYPKSSQDSGEKFHKGLIKPNAQFCGQIKCNLP